MKPYHKDRWKHENHLERKQRYQDDKFKIAFYGALVFIAAAIIYEHVISPLIQ